MPEPTVDRPPARDQRVAPRLSPAKQVTFALIAVVLALAALESGLRAYHWVRNLGSPIIQPRGYIVDDREAGYVLKPGFNEGGVRVNQLGFRGPEITREKPEGTYRVVAIGDSVTFGPTEQECAYPFQLATQLGDPQVQVIDAGIEGYRSDRALVHLRRDVEPLKPDLVSIFIGWNDLYQTDPRAEHERLAIRGNPLAELLAMSDLAQTFRRFYFERLRPERARLAGPSVGDASLLASYQPEGYEQRLRDLIQTARQGGADVVVFTWPTILGPTLSQAELARVHYPWYTTQLAELETLYERYQAATRADAAKEQVPIYDAAALFQSLPNRGGLFKDTLHFSCEGHSLLAHDLAAKLKTGLVPSYPRRSASNPSTRTVAAASR